MECSPVLVLDGLEARVNLVQMVGELLGGVRSGIGQHDALGATALHRDADDEAVGLERRDRHGDRRLEEAEAVDDARDGDGRLVDEQQAEQDELAGDFCRGCGYCLPCPMGIEINNCARMSLMVRRAPSAKWLSEEYQEKMAKIETCIGCRQCTRRCPYELDTPELLRKNLADYRKILAGIIEV